MKRPNVLVIDDESDFANLLVDYLENTGKFVAKAVTNSASGLESALNNPPDIILLDVMMPGMNGFELLGELKKDKRLYSVPVIFLTALIDSETESKAYNSYAEGFLVKPTPFNRIVSSIEKIIKTKEYGNIPRENEGPRKDDALTLEELKYKVKMLEKESKWRRQAQRELQEREERLNIIFEFAPDPFFVCDLEGKFLFGNKAIYTLTGYRRSELEHKNVFQTSLIPDYQTSRIAEIIESSEGGLTTGPEEFVIIHKDGQKVYVEIQTYPTKINEKQVILCIARDITKRKELERIAKESEEMFRMAVENSPIGISILSSDGVCKYCNPKFTEIFGYTLKEILPGKVWFEKVYPDPASKQEAISKWINDVKNNQAGEISGSRFNVTCKDGTVKNVLFRPFIAKSGEIYIFYDDLEALLT